MANFSQLSFKLGILLLLVVCINSQNINNYLSPNNFYKHMPSAVKKTGRSVFNAVGNSIKSVGSMITSGNPIDDAVNTTGNTTGDAIKPVKGIIESSLGLVAGTVYKVLDKTGNQLIITYPGTLWCGRGNVWTRHGSVGEELGRYAKTDSCCRSHDKCLNIIFKGETKYGLYNNGILTKFDCECEEVFYNCLKNTKSLPAKQVGIIYFSLLNPQCYKYDYPATCIRYGMTLLLQKKCLEYSYNKSQDQEWQWFDNLSF